MTAQIINADCLVALELMPSNSIDSCVTDPPYHLQSIQKRFAKVGRNDKTWSKSGPHQRTANGFMNQTWDGGDIAFRPDVWIEVLRVLKPGGHLLAFGGTRTYHRLACAIEDAGFEIRDQIGWLYGSGFPKSHNQDGDWQGWGTALKPAWEPIVFARKPLNGTVAGNLAAWGVGAINVGGCRVAGAKPDTTRGAGGQHGAFSPLGAQGRIEDDGKGRWPANLIHDGSDEVLAAFPSSASKPGKPRSSAKPGDGWGMTATGAEYDDSGSAARFFYCAKASRSDRDDGLGAFEKKLRPSALARVSQLEGKEATRISGTKNSTANSHPTVKPTDLMRYLCRLVTPPGGTVLDPFTGSGSTGRGAVLEGFNFVGIELMENYAAIARARIAAVSPLAPDTGIFA